jgi:hypothetical protein
LFRRVRLGVAWPRALEGEAEATQVLPAPLGVDRASQCAGHPGGDLRAGPEATVGGWALQGCPQRLLLLDSEEWRCATAVCATISEADGAVLVVAAGDGLDPDGTVPGCLGHRPGGVALCEQPDDLKVAPFNRVGCLPVAGLEVSETQMRVQNNTFWHTA